VRIYEILGTNANASPVLRQLAGFFETAIGISEKHDWRSAESAFAQVSKLSPEDGPALLYQSRCQQYQQYPPKENWDGVFNITEK
jgi:adenylate cyclase